MIMVTGDYEPALVMRMAMLPMIAPSIPNEAIMIDNGYSIQVHQHEP